MGLARQEGEVLGAGSVLEFFDVGIVNSETELVKFILDVLDNLEALIRLEVKDRTNSNLPFA